MIPGEPVLDRSECPREAEGYDAGGSSGKADFSVAPVHEVVGDVEGETATRKEAQSGLAFRDQRSFRGKVREIRDVRTDARAEEGCQAAFGPCQDIAVITADVEVLHPAVGKHRRIYCQLVVPRHIVSKTAGRDPKQV